MKENKKENLHEIERLLIKRNILDYKDLITELIEKGNKEEMDDITVFSILSNLSDLKNTLEGIENLCKTVLSGTIFEKQASQK